MPKIGNLSPGSCHLYRLHQWLDRSICFHLPAGQDTAAAIRDGDLHPMWSAAATVGALHTAAVDAGAGILLFCSLLVIQGTPQKLVF